MTKTIEAKPVREARAEARRMAKKTNLTYQQALDRIARDAGTEHWAAYVAMHPAPANDPTPRVPQGMRSTSPGADRTPSRAM